MPKTRLPLSRILPWLPALLAGCVAEAPGQAPAGALSLALTQSAPDGEVYHLRDVVLSVAGAAETKWTPPADEPLFRAELPPGDYTLTLEPGWRLERTGEDGAVPVEASLVGDNPQPFRIEADTTTAVALRFALVEGEPVAAPAGILEVGLVVEEPAAGPCTPRLVINEVDYDQEGADEAELIELLNPSPCAFPTAELALVLHNGGTTDGAPAVYAAIDLAQAGPSVEAGAYLVVADEAVLAALDPAIPALSLGATSLQNGDPDGITLELEGQVLDAVGYGGPLGGITEGSSAPADPGAGALGRCPDGSDSQDNGADFALLPAPSPGAPNPC